MIYGAQQTIKLIRPCVFPEEGPAGGCGKPIPAPSLFGSTANVKFRLPAESLRPFGLIVHAVASLGLTYENTLSRAPHPTVSLTAKRPPRLLHAPLSAGLWL